MTNNNSVSTARFQTVAQFTAGRSGHPVFENEDAVFSRADQTGDIMAVVDGITAQTDWRVDTRDEHGAIHHVTAGWLAKEAVLAELAVLTPDNTDSLAGRIFKRWRAIATMPAFPDHEVVGAVFAVYVPWLHEIHLLGDCAYGWETEENGIIDWHPSFKDIAPDSSDARTRADMIRMLMDEDSDLERNLEAAQHRAIFAHAGLSAMQERRIQRHGIKNHWLSDLAVLQSRLKRISVPAAAKRVILCSDGFLHVPRNLEDGLAQVEQWRAKDPFMIGIDGGPMTAKGFVDIRTGEILRFTDDMAFIEGRYF